MYIFKSTETPSISPGPAARLHQLQTPTTRRPNTLPFLLNKAEFRPVRLHVERLGPRLSLNRGTNKSQWVKAHLWLPPPRITVRAAAAAAAAVRPLSTEDWTCRSSSRSFASKEQNEAEKKPPSSSYTSPLLKKYPGDVARLTVKAVRWLPRSSASSVPCALSSRALSLSQRYPGVTSRLIELIYN